MEINLSQYTLTSLFNSLVYLISAFVLLFLGKIIFQLFYRTYRADYEMVEKDNFAFAIAMSGYYVGLLFAIGSALYGESFGLVNDLIAIAYYGIVAIILLNASIFINDLVILRKFKIKKEIIEDQNAGTGVVVAASSIATGIIIYNSLTVEGTGMLYGIIYWFVAQLLLILVGVVYDLILPFSIHKQIEKDNVAVGVGFAGAIIAIAIIISHSIHEWHTNWADFFVNILIYTVVGLIFLPIARLLTDKILLPGRKMNDEIVNQEKPNIGVALIEAFAYIGGAILISWVM